MTSGRPRIVALQAIVVACLLAVVYLTLLRPEGEMPLFGVEDRGREQPAAGGVHNGQPHAGKKHDEQGAPAGPGRGDGAPIVVGAITTRGGTALPPSIPSQGSIPGWTRPSDDQYEDSLGRLLGRLGSGAAGEL